MTNREICERLQRILGRLDAVPPTQVITAMGRTQTALEWATTLATSVQRCLTLAPDAPADEEEAQVAALEAAVESVASGFSPGVYPWVTLGGGLLIGLTLSWVWKNL